MKNDHPDDLTELHRSMSIVDTADGEKYYDDWCASECRRIGKNASVRKVNLQGIEFCCVSVKGLGARNQNNNDN